jgi:hypothetical protein
VGEQSNRDEFRRLEDDFERDGFEVFKVVIPVWPEAPDEALRRAITESLREIADGVAAGSVPVPRGRTDKYALTTE